ncbi:MAG: glycosyltransferase family 2 protein [Firmicutes bacterium]|nr:glycosyltransferase family 2 protein [Bacillota bacterium]
MAAEELVSVVVPCFNHGRFLEEVLSSIWAQTYPNIEAVVVNDGSTDETETVAMSWLSRAYEGRRLTYLKLPGNCGYAWAANIGFYISSGTFLAMNDADDISLPTRLASQVSQLSADRCLMLLGTNYASFWHGEGEGREMARWIQYGEAVRKSYERGVHCVCFGTAMMRRILVEDTGGLNKLVVGSEDWEFVRRVVKAGHKVDNLPSVLYLYRRHPDQRTRIYHPD